MSVLSRNNYTGQQRLDLADLLASESFAAFDIRALISSFVGSDKAYVLRGLEVVGKTGLTIQINVADALTYNPQDGNGSFYLGLPDDEAFNLTLPANQSNVYVEARFINESRAPVSKAFWDPLALTGDTASGTEFSASTNSQVVTVLEITANTVGFSEGAIPLLRASTNASSVTSLSDRRPSLFRLGVGGASPDPLAKFNWSTARSEPLQTGAGVGDAIDSSWRARDSVGAINDKGIRTHKEWMDAVMTRLAEISGTSLWYQGASGSASNISVSQLFFDILGSHIQPSANSSFIWKRSGGNLVLASEGYLAGGPHAEGLIKWRSNNSGIEWQLGGTFVNDTPGGSRSYAAGQYRFESPAPVDNGNVYLKLEREVSKGSGADVSWKDNSAYGGFTLDKSISGSPGDFTGIAIGDYVRKESEGYTRYYRVTKIYNGTLALTAQNTIADNTAVALEVENITNPAVGIVGIASSEPLIFFRSRYSNDDVIADTVANTYNVQDANFIWLGRRSGDLFILKDYGTMQENEEILTLEDSFQPASPGMSDINVEHAKEAYYDSVSGYDLKTGSGTLLTIRRRKSDNTTETPGSGDNSNAILEYTIDAPVGTMTAGQSLWVRLSDTTDGAVTGGSVTDATSDSENADSAGNLWEIRDDADTPLRTYDNRNVFLVARKAVIDGLECLKFFDGSVLGPYGLQLSQNVEVRGELKVQHPLTSVLFIDDTIDGEVDSDVANLFFDKTAGIFGFENFRAQDSDIYLAVADDVSLFSNLGAHTATIGGADSTTYIPGTLIVAGNVIAGQTTEIMIEDKLVTLGLGSLNNGGYNAGIEAVDDSRYASDMTTSSLSPDVIIEFPVAPGYLTGDIIGVSTEDDVGGITAGQISGKYTIVAVLTSPGEALISGTTLTVRTAYNATDTILNQATTTTLSFKTPWSFKVSASDGNTSGYTSWRFQVKNITTTPTLTPVFAYGVVPTAHSTDFRSERIPFAGDDNQGPGGFDTTLNFSPNFSWRNGTNTLEVVGTVDATSIKSDNVYWGVSSVKTANYSMTTDLFVQVDTSASSTVTITLPEATAQEVGRIAVIKDVGGAASTSGKNIIVEGFGSDTIDDELNYTFFNDYESVTLICNAAGSWSII